ncbi:MAG: GumC family protein, partial [Candidatus Rokuibacteriota bacterium]
TRSFNIDDARLTREFLEQQLADIKKTLMSSEQSLRGFVAAHGGVRIPERHQATISQLTQTEHALAEIEASRKMLQTRVHGLREKVESQKAEPPAPAPPPPLRAPAPEIQRLRTLLTQLETALLDLRTKYTEEHPRIRLVKDRIAEVQGQLGGAVKDTAPAPPSVAAVPPAERVNFVDQLVALESSLYAITSQEDALRKQAEGLRQRLKGLSAGEQEYARLTRESESARNLYTLFSDKLNAARIREQAEMKVVKVIDPPTFPTAAANQKRLTFVMAAFMLAVATGAAVPSAIELLHNRVDGQDDVDLSTGLPVLALVPQIRGRRPHYTETYKNTGRGPSDQMMFTEALRALRVTLQLAMRERRLRTLLIASPLAHEGKSTLVLSLGLALQEAGLRVVLADTDFQRPTLHLATDVKSNGGLVDALHHSDHHAEGALAPVGQNLWLAPRGHALLPRTRGMLGGHRLPEILAELAQKADVVICDSSPILLIPDNLFLAGAVDGVILVAKAGSTGSRDLAATKSLLENAGARILGVVINEVPASSLMTYYNRYYHSYLKDTT